MNSITIIHEVRLAPETMVWLDNLVLRVAREALVSARAVSNTGGGNVTEPGYAIPQGSESQTTGRVKAPPPVSRAGQGGTPFGTVASGAPPASDPAPIAATSSDARPARDEPAILDVSSPPSSQPAAVLPAGSVDGTHAPAVMTKPAGADFPKAILWSPERDAVLKEGYPAGDSNRVLLDHVNALPGREVRLDQVLPRCMYLKLRRAPGVVRRPVSEPENAAPEADEAPEVLERTADEIAQWCAFAKYRVDRVTEATLPAINAFRAKKGMPPYALIAKAPPPPPKPPHPASYATILRWANQRGLCMDGVLDLDVVNAKATALGLAPFELEAAPRRSVPSIIRHHQQGEPEHAP